MTLLWISVFGLLGVLSRYTLDQLFLKVSSPIPVGTLVINLLGSALAGIVFVIGTERGWIGPELRTGLMVGFLGGFTTFSAYTLQTAKLLETGFTLPGALYLLISPALGLAAAWVGLRIGRAL